MSREAVLKYMIDNDLFDHKRYMVSHHFIENPNRIDIKTDEVVYIDNITIIPASNPFFLEFHSATESRIVQIKSFKQITRHKGHIYFSNNNVNKYNVSFVKLKLIN